jgi:hypothetical protein
MITYKERASGLNQDLKQFFSQYGYLIYIKGQQIVGGLFAGLLFFDKFPHNSRLFHKELWGNLSKEVSFFHLMPFSSSFFFKCSRKLHIRASRAHRPHAPPLLKLRLFKFQKKGKTLLCTGTEQMVLAF